MNAAIMLALRELRKQRQKDGMQTIFTTWQRGIIEKRLCGDSLTKSEANEFSQRIKPKIRALNDLRDLHLLL